MVIVVEGIDSIEKAKPLVGKKVTYVTESGKEISGKVSHTHGNKGAIRAIFDRGMPGQSLTKSVQINSTNSGQNNK